jgi:alpha-L-fucosidase
MPANVDWLVEDRFGMFIHWGLRSLLARGEWVMSREEIPELFLRHAT